MSHQLLGPFRQLLTLEKLPSKGPLRDEQLGVHENAGLLCSEQGHVLKIAPYGELLKDPQVSQWKQDTFREPMVALPGFIDAHTHLCWGGSRAQDYQLRVRGVSYLEIAQAGGGIMDSVQKTRAASSQTLLEHLLARCTQLLERGVTTAEVKTGYGLSPEQELRVLEVYQQAKTQSSLELVPTCLAAHIKPKDFSGSAQDYLNLCLKDLLPQVKAKKLARRVDIFVEPSAFGLEDARSYLKAAQALGFELTLHADQFTPMGSHLAVELNARSADHLEASTEKEIQALAQSSVVAVALPGASLGLGMNFAPARRLLDAGACLAIASDWNPGSAPMGNLLTQAALLGAFEKLSTAETLAGITIRAAQALGLEASHGSLEIGKQADLIAFATDDFREILYHQGQLKPARVWKRGTLQHVS